MQKRSYDSNYAVWLSGGNAPQEASAEENVPFASSAEQIPAPTAAFLKGKTTMSSKDQELYDMTDHELLVTLVKETRADKRAQKRASAGAWAIAVILFVACLILVPRAIATMGQLNTTMESITETSTQLQGTLSGIDTIVSDADKIVRDNTDYVNEAIQKLNAIDFDALNESIESLQKIVTPLAALFGN